MVPLALKSHDREIVRILSLTQQKYVPTDKASASKPTTASGDACGTKNYFVPQAYLPVVVGFETAGQCRKGMESTVSWLASGTTLASNKNSRYEKVCSPMPLSRVDRNKHH